MPGGNALRLFFPFFEGLPSSRVAGTLSKYGSFQGVSYLRGMNLQGSAHLLAEIILKALSKEPFGDIICKYGRHVCDMIWSESLMQIETVK